MKAFASALVALSVLAAPATAAPERWIGSYAAPPTPPMPPPAGQPANPRSTPSFKDQTVVQHVRLSAGGKRLRLRLANDYSGKPLMLGAVRVAVVGADGRPGPEKAVTFAGEGRAVVPPRGPLISDPVDLPTGPLTILRVAIHVSGDPGPCVCHALGVSTTRVSPPGDHTAKDFAPVSTTTMRPYLTAVEVEGARAQPVIVAFGDSITDGFGATVDANRRWPDILAERLKGKAAIVNAGISGNRVLSDGAIAMFGEAALSRFDRDVLSVPGATHMIVLEGVNDLGGRPNPTAAELIAGYRQLIARAHAHGIKVYLATILPYGGAGYFRAEAEKERAAVNAWIRSNKEADGAIDFDAVIRDPVEPTKMRKDLHVGDWLHPNDAGYKLMGEAVDLKLFR